MNTQIESLLKVDKKKRQKEILDLLEMYPYGLTARQIAIKLGYVERNATSPRLTELEAKWKIKRNGKAYDFTTQRNVTVYILDRRCHE